MPRLLQRLTELLRPAVGPPELTDMESQRPPASAVSKDLRKAVQAPPREDPGAVIERTPRLVVPAEQRRRQAKR